MPRFVALLRAINVGGRVVKMDRLRSLFEGLGFSNVETFIASGNVIFESPARNPQALERKIEAHLQKSLSYAVPTFIRSAPELVDVARYEPFATSELCAGGHALYIVFLPATPTPDQEQKLLSFRSRADDFHVHKREVYWLCRRKLSESAFSGAMLDRTLRMPATMRNSTTVRKLAARLDR